MKLSPTPTAEVVSAFRSIIASPVVPSKAAVISTNLAVAATVPAAAMVNSVSASVPSALVTPAAAKYSLSVPLVNPTTVSPAEPEA